MSNDSVRVLVREAVAKALERLADVSEGTAQWTENNFLPGPNGDYAIRHEREMAERLLGEAEDWRMGYCDVFVEGVMTALESGRTLVPYDWYAQNTYGAYYRDIKKETDDDTE